MKKQHVRTESPENEQQYRHPDRSTTKAETSARHVRNTVFENAHHPANMHTQFHERNQNILIQKTQTHARTQACLCTTVPSHRQPVQNFDRRTRASATNNGVLAQVALNPTITSCIPPGIVFY
jgi:hypothetical protein